MSAVALVQEEPARPLTVPPEGNERSESGVVCFEACRQPRTLFEPEKLGGLSAPWLLGFGLALDVFWNALAHADAHLGRITKRSIKCLNAFIAFHDLKVDLHAASIG